MEMQRMKLRNHSLVLALCSALLLCIPSLGQVLKGSISGTVADPQGAVVSGATVKATQAGGVTYTTTSDSSGLFRFNLIPPGTYKVEVTKPGFKTAVQNNVLVTAVSDKAVGTLALAVGEPRTSVQVNPEAALTDTTQPHVPNTLSSP